MGSRRGEMAPSRHQDIDIDSASLREKGIDSRQADKSRNWQSSPSSAEEEVEQRSIQSLGPALPEQDRFANRIFLICFPVGTQCRPVTP